MKTFIYYSKNDPNKEAISRLYSNDLDQAIDSGCAIKNLPKSEFLKLFKVEEYGTKNQKINFGHNGSWD